MDDEYFGIDAVVRGQDLWDRTLAQQYLAQMLGKPFFQEVVFYHHPLVMEAAGYKEVIEIGKCHVYPAFEKMKEKVEKMCW